MKTAVNYILKKDGERVPILECDLIAPEMDENSENPELSEYLVRVEWTKTIPRADAYRETGMFANQNTVCKLRNQFTLEKLYSFFQLEE
ncbi:MAG TPA: hypothetical protein VMW28_00345 [Pelolinea sp.]|nr:hypothetical protein [Pelolinea sp.]